MKTTQTGTSGCQAQSPARNGSATAVADSCATTSDNEHADQATISSETQPNCSLVAAGCSTKLNLATRRLLWFLIVGVLMVLVILGTSRYLTYTRSRVKTDNAYLATHIHSVSARVAGTVKEVLVEDNQMV